MEAYVLDDDSVKSRLQNYVFIQLFVDDKRSHESKVVSRKSKDKGQSIGDINSAIQREQFGANAQPFFVQLDPYGHSIAEPMVFTTDPATFIQWLQY